MRGINHKGGRNPTYDWSSMAMSDEQKEMAERNIGLVYHIINKYCYKKINENHVDVYSVNRVYDVADFVGAGYVGLCKGCMTYDNTKGFTESTYLSICILTEVRREVYKNNPFKHDFETPNNEIQYSLNYVVLDEKTNDKLELIDFMIDESQSIESLSDFHVLEIIDNGINEIFKTQRKQEQVRKWVELKSLGYSQTEIAKEFGCSRAEVSRGLRLLYKYVKKELNL